jgi:hypothetical protein
MRLPFDQLPPQNSRTSPLVLPSSWHRPSNSGPGLASIESSNTNTMREAASSSGRWTVKERMASSQDRHHPQQYEHHDKVDRHRSNCEDDDEDDEESSSPSHARQSSLRIGIAPVVRSTLKPSLSSTATAEWDQAFAMLEHNPKLLTRKILLSALRRRAPAPLIAYMLRLDPTVAAASAVRRRFHDNRNKKEATTTTTMLLPAEPTPLQVALQSQCSLEVIELLLQAWPFALVVKAPGSQMYPLSYAKIIRSDEPDLIAMLSRPVKFWLEQQRQQHQKQQHRDDTDDVGDADDDETDDSTIGAIDTSEETVPTTHIPPRHSSAAAAAVLDRKATVGADRKSLIREASDCRTPLPRIKKEPGSDRPNRSVRGTTDYRTPLPRIKTAPEPEPPTGAWTFARLVSPEAASQASEPASMTVSPQTMHPVKINTMDPNEIKNVKLICMSVLKGHKRLVRDMAEVQRTFDALVATERKTVAPSIAQLIQSHGNSILQQVNETQKKFAGTQMLMLQQNEQAMKEYVHRTEHRLIRSMAQRQQETQGNMELHVDAVVQELQARLSQFSNRIAFLEQVVYFTAKRSSSASSSSRRRAAAASVQPPPVITLARPTVARFMAERNRALHNPNVCHNTSDQSFDVASASPFSKADEMRALLTEATSKDRPDGTTTHSHCFVQPKKRWLHGLRTKLYGAC